MCTIAQEFRIVQLPYLTYAHLFVLPNDWDTKPLPTTLDDIAYPGSTIVQTCVSYAIEWGQQYHLRFWKFLHNQFHVKTKRIWDRAERCRPSILHRTQHRKALLRSSVEVYSSSYSILSAKSDLRHIIAIFVVLVSALATRQFVQHIHD